MEIEGQHHLPAPRSVVWSMLNDPEVLKACIPGCQALEASSPTNMSATVTTKIGPIKATFAGEVQLTDLVPPSSYSIVGEGKGGIAGFAKGKADVALHEDGDGTLLKYKVDVAIGGKIAQLGSRLVSSTAKKLSEQFFDCFAQKVAGRAE